MSGYRPLGTHPIGHELVPVAGAGGGTTVSVTAGSLSLTGLAPTVSIAASIAVPAASLSLTGFAPTVGSPATVSVPAGSLSLSGFAPSASTPRTISVPAGSLSLTGYAPTVSTTAAGTTVSIPSGSLSLTGLAPTVSISAVIPMAAGSLALTAYAPTIYTTAGTIVSVPAGGLTLSGFAPTVYTLGGSTTSVWYLPVRMYATGVSGGVDSTQALDNLRSLLPSMNVPAVDSQGKFTPSWYRFLDYLVNVFLGGPGAPTMADVQAAIEAAIAAQTLASQTTALLQQQTQANAEALGAVVEVVTANALTGASQIPPVSRSYLEP